MSFFRFLRVVLTVNLHGSCSGPLGPSVICHNLKNRLKTNENISFFKFVGVVLTVNFNGKNQGFLGRRTPLRSTSQPGIVISGLEAPRSSLRSLSQRLSLKPPRQASQASCGHIEKRRLGKPSRLRLPNKYLFT